MKVSKNNNVNVIGGVYGLQAFEDDEALPSRAILKLGLECLMNVLATVFPSAVSSAESESKFWTNESKCRVNEEILTDIDRKISDYLRNKKTRKGLRLEQRQAENKQGETLKDQLLKACQQLVYADGLQMFATDQLIRIIKQLPAETYACAEKKDQTAVAMQLAAQTFNTTTPKLNDDDVLKLIERLVIKEPQASSFFTSEKIRMRQMQHSLMSTIAKLKKDLTDLEAQEITKKASCEALQTEVEDIHKWLRSKGNKDDSVSKKEKIKADIETIQTKIEEIKETAKVQIGTLKLGGASFDDVESTISRLEIEATCSKSTIARQEAQVQEYLVRKVEQEVATEAAVNELEELKLKREHRKRRVKEVRQSLASLKESLRNMGIDTSIGGDAANIWANERSSWECERNGLEAEIRKVEENITKAETLIEKSCDLMPSYAWIIRGLKENTKATDAFWITALSLVESEIASEQSKQSADQKEIEVAKKKHDALESEVEVLRLRKVSLEEARNACAEQIKTKRIKLEEISSSLNAAKTRLEGVKKEHAKAEAENKNLERLKTETLESLETVNIELTASVREQSRVEEEIKRIKSELETAVEKLSSVQNKYSELNKEQNKLEDLEQQRNTELESLKRTKQEIQKLQDELQTYKVPASGKVTSLKVMLNRSQSIIDRNLEELAQLTDEKKILEGKKKSLTEKKDSANTNLERSIAKRDKLQQKQQTRE